MFCTVCPSPWLLVALRKESVDRNIDNWTWTAGMWVALRKESVDRNIKKQEEAARNFPSLSARRAWIEMTITNRAIHGRRVALRKESVDRNIR